MKILIVEDDTDINNLLAKIMQKQGYETVQAFSGTEGNLRLSMDTYDLMLLDLMMPGMMGEELLKNVREKSDMPVIVLSAKSSLQDKVSVLNLGADDYLTKPFENEEVVARVNGVLRRYRKFANSGQSGMPESENTAGADVMTFRNLTLHMASREVTVNGTALSLTAHEFDILALLMQNPGKVYSRESLYEEVWQGGYYGEDNTVNVHVSNLRKKIAAADDQEYIKTVWGIGFKLAN